MAEKTIKYAADQLPIKVQKIFLEIWKELGLMDIYDGDLEMYFTLIRQVLIHHKEMHEKFKKILIDTLDEVDKVTKMC